MAGHNGGAGVAAVYASGVLAAAEPAQLPRMNARVEIMMDPFPYVLVQVNSLSCCFTPGEMRPTGSVVLHGALTQRFDVS